MPAIVSTTQRATTMRLWARTQRVSDETNDLLPPGKGSRSRWLIAGRGETHRRSVGWVGASMIDRRPGSPCGMSLGPASRARCVRQVPSVCDQRAAVEGLQQRPRAGRRGGSVQARRAAASSPSSRASRSTTVPPSSAASRSAGGNAGARPLAQPPGDRRAGVRRLAGEATARRPRSSQRPARRAAQLARGGTAAAAAGCWRRRRAGRRAPPGRAAASRASPATLEARSAQQRAGRARAARARPAQPTR